MSETDRSVVHRKWPIDVPGGQLGRTQRDLTLHYAYRVTQTADSLCFISYFHSSSLLY
jgi:hypothetical protein